MPVYEATKKKESQAVNTFTARHATLDIDTSRIISVHKYVIIPHSKVLSLNDETGIFSPVFLQPCFSQFSPWVSLWRQLRRQPGGNKSLSNSAKDPRGSWRISDTTSKLLNRYKQEWSKLELLNHREPSSRSLHLLAVCVGEEGRHAVVERLEATQVDRRSLCLGAVFRTRGLQRWHLVHLLQLLWGEEGKKKCSKHDLPPTITLVLFSQRLSNLHKILHACHLAHMSTLASFLFLPFLLVILSVSSCLHQWSDHPGPGVKWLQTHVCHLHSRAHQTEVADQTGSCHRAGNAWLGGFAEKMNLTDWTQKYWDFKVKYLHQIIMVTFLQYCLFYVNLNQPHQKHLLYFRRCVLSFVFVSFCLHHLPTL